MKLPHKARDASHLFDTLLAGIDFRHATDPRDHIYGVLGLLPDHKDDDLLRPDYSLSVAQVYGRAGFIIKHLLSSSYKKYGFYLDSKHSSFSIHYSVNITFTDQAKSLR
jgi:hypothetical protein